jgi:hypothetical protein
MYKIDFDSEKLKAIKEQLKGIEKKKWGKILSYATTETAFYVRNKLKKEMPTYIDRPSPYTLNSIFVDKGTGKDPEAVVQWRKPSGGTSGGRYLLPQVDGGGRETKRFENALVFRGGKARNDKAVPTDAAPKDAFGNVPGSYIKRMLSLLRVGTKALREKRERAEDRQSRIQQGLVKERKKKDPRGPSFARAMKDQRKPAAPPIAQVKSSYGSHEEFIVLPKRVGKKPPGVYEVKNMALGRAMKLVFAFVTTVTYKKKFPFYDIGTKASAEKFQEKLSEAIKKEMENS